MINTIIPGCRVNSNNLQEMLYKSDIIKSLAVQMVANQAEAHIDMMNDCPDEYRSFVDFDGCIQHSKETVVDYINDALYDFKEALLAAVSEVEITTNGIILKKDAIDADIVVKMK